MTYQTLYFRLVAAIDDALTLLERGKGDDAAALLQNALTEAEECHMENDAIPEK